MQKCSHLACIFLNCSVSVINEFIGGLTKTLVDKLEILSSFY